MPLHEMCETGGDTAVNGYNKGKDQREGIQGLLLIHHMKEDAG